MEGVAREASSDLGKIVCAQIWMGLVLVGACSRSEFGKMRQPSGRLALEIQEANLERMEKEGYGKKH